MKLHGGGLYLSKLLLDRMSSRNIVSWNSILHAYAAIGNIQEARQVFELMPERNVVSFTCPLQAYAQQRLFFQAQSFFEEIPVVSWTTTFQAYAENGHLREAKLMFHSMPERSLVSWNSMIAAEYASGHPERAKSVFDMMPEWNTVTFTTMVAAYAHFGHGREAIGLIRAMDLHGVSPDQVSFTHILAGCNHGGLVEESLLVFQLMNGDHGIAARAEHFSCLIDLLGRSGHFDKAKELAVNLPVHGAAWGALLSASRFHRDLKEAKDACQRFAEMEPKCSSPHVPLAAMIEVKK